MEAGTGHGALTLHLARAIHGANPSILPEALTELTTELYGKAPPESDDRAELGNGKAVTSSLSSSDEDVNESSGSVVAVFRKSRRAIIHTVDIKATHSQWARQVVRGFRRGLYAGDVDFHVADVNEWISTQLAARKAFLTQDMEAPFLSHIILDAPDSQKLIAKAAEALLTGGTLVLFCPSISQIMTAVKTVKAEKLPLVLDKVLETGSGMTGGKEWDVRAVKPRSLSRAEAARVLEPFTEEIADHNSVAIASLDIEDQSKESAPNIPDDCGTKTEDAGWEMICRPKVGERLIGGGFLGVWKKMKQRE